MTTDTEQLVCTPRLVLEPQRAAHAEALFALLADPSLYLHENAPPASLDELRDRLTRLEARQSADGSEGWLNWVLRLHDGRVAGYVQATVQADGSAWVAYVLGSAHWRQGFTSEAVTAMIDVLVTQHAVHTLRAVYKRSNAPSIRLLERLGFRLAEADDPLRADIEADEDLMWRHAAAAPG